MHADSFHKSIPFHFLSLIPALTHFHKWVVTCNLKTRAADSGRQHQQNLGPYLKCKISRRVLVPRCSDVRESLGGSALEQNAAE